MLRFTIAPALFDKICCEPYEYCGCAAFFIPEARNSLAMKFPAKTCLGGDTDVQHLAWRHPCVRAFVCSAVGARPKCHYLTGESHGRPRWKPSIYKADDGAFPGVGHVGRRGIPPGEYDG